MMKHFRLMAAALCAAFLLCGMTAPAYAYSDEPTGGYEETDPAPTDEDATVEEAPAPEPIIEPGEGFRRRASSSPVTCSTTKTPTSSLSLSRPRAAARSTLSLTTTSLWTRRASSMKPTF